MDLMPSTQNEWKLLFTIGFRTKKLTYYSVDQTFELYMYRFCLRFLQMESDAHTTVAALIMSHFLYGQDHEDVSMPHFANDMLILLAVVRVLNSTVDDSTSSCANS